MTGNLFLQQEISSSGAKFLTQNFFPGQDISGIFHPSDSILHQKCVIFGYISIATKVHDFCSKFLLKVQGFLPRFLAPWPLKSNPGVSDRPTDQE